MRALAAASTTLKRCGCCMRQMHAAAARGSCIRRLHAAAACSSCMRQLAAGAWCMVPAWRFPVNCALPEVISSSRLFETHPPLQGLLPFPHLKAHRFSNTPLPPPPRLCRSGTTSLSSSQARRFSNTPPPRLCRSGTTPLSRRWWLRLRSCWRRAKCATGRSQMRPPLAW